MESRIITIPRGAKPVIDRTEFENGALVFLLCFETWPLWVSGVNPCSVFGREAWIAFQQPPVKASLKTHRGILFPLRERAIRRAEEMITCAANQLFRCA